jgi:hypothetical protein
MIRKVKRIELAEAARVSARGKEGEWTRKAIRNVKYTQCIVSPKITSSGGGANRSSTFRASEFQLFVNTIRNSCGLRTAFLTFLHSMIGGSHMVIEVVVHPSDGNEAKKSYDTTTFSVSKRMTGKAFPAHDLRDGG